MREFHPSPASLTGSLLIAHPSLFDPNFRRAAVLIGSHDSVEGAHGIIINRPTENTVADLLPSQEMGVLANLPVFVGGPVQQDRLTFAALRWREESGIIECKTHLDVAGAKELAAKKTFIVRAFAGYSGWSKGQLETELAQKAWIVRKPERDALDIEKCRELWGSIMRGLGPWFRLLAAAPDDPSRN